MTMNGYQMIANLVGQLKSDMMKVEDAVTKFKTEMPYGIIEAKKDGLSVTCAVRKHTDGSLFCMKCDSKMTYLGDAPDGEYLGWECPTHGTNSKILIITNTAEDVGPSQLESMVQVDNKQTQPKKKLVKSSEPDKTRSAQEIRDRIVQLEAIAIAHPKDPTFRVIPDKLVELKWIIYEDD